MNNTTTTTKTVKLDDFEMFVLPTAGQYRWEIKTAAQDKPVVAYGYHTSFNQAVKNVTNARTALVDSINAGTHIYGESLADYVNA